MTEDLRTIDLHLDTTTQLLSGPNGSGKTTELLRLKGNLEANGFTVAIVDILQFVNRSAPIDIARCLLAVARGAGEQLHQRELVRNLGRKRDFRDGSRYQEVACYFQQLAAARRKTKPKTRGLVVIVDNLEKLRGTQVNDEEVVASARNLFVLHADKLRFRSHHMVYTVPTYLPFTALDTRLYDGRVRPVPIPHVRNRAGVVDEEAKRSVDELVDVVAKRIPWERLLGDRDNLDRVITASGGHLRDLFLILHEVITQVYGRRLDLPVTTSHVEEALDSMAHSFSSVTSEQASFLRRVAAGGDGEPSEGEVHLMARLMDTHMLLAHRNGKDWYEVHPLARRSLGL